MSFLPQARIDELVNIGRSGAQKAAIARVLNEVAQDVTLRDDQPEPKNVLVEPTTDAVVFVLNGERTTDSDIAHLYRSLDYIQERMGSVHVITAGRMGVELAAMKWASRHEMPVSEFGACWALPQPDGSTKRNPNARSPRNAKLRLVGEKAVEQGKTVLVLTYGTERGNDQVEKVLVRAGAKPRKTSPLYDERKHGVQAPASKPEDLPVAETPADDPGAVLAGQPDVEPQPA